MSIISIRPRVYAQSDYVKAITAHIEIVAKSRGYDSAQSICSYVASANQAWATEAAAFIAWRDAVWSYVYQQLVAVQSQQRTQPTPAALIAELPLIGWPS